MKFFLPVYFILMTCLGFWVYQESELSESRARGKEVYADFCVTCHLDNGEGVAYTFPPLANSDYLATKREASIHAVKYGLQGEITVNGTTYNSAMTAMGLEDEEVADVMNYIMNAWGNTQDEMVTVKEVEAIEN